MTRELLPVAVRRDTARLAWHVLRDRWPVLVATALAFAVVGAAGVVPPYVIGQLVDTVRSGDEGPATIYRYAGVIATAAVVGAVATAASVALLAQAAAPAVARLREDVLERVLHLDVSRVEAAGAGDVLSRVGDDARQVTESFDEAVPLLVNSLVAIGFTGVGLLALDWRLAVAGMLALPLWFTAMRWYLPRSAPYYRRERTAHGERAEALVTGLQGSATLRAFGMERSALDRVDTTSRAGVTITVDVFRLLTRLFGRMNRAELVGLLLVLGTGFWLVDSGSSSVGAATAAALYFHRLFNPIGAVLMVFDEVQSAGASLARLAGVALLPCAPTTRPHDPGPAPALRLHGIDFAYEAGHDVLSGIDLVARPGRTVALVGATGAGKTTLGGIAAGLLAPTRGTVRLGDLDLVALPESEVRRHVALVSQEVHVFDGTVRDNLLLAAPGSSDDDLWRALEVTGSREWVASLPDGIRTVVGSTGRRLGAGHAQQLALARLVLRDPVVAILDEATAEAGSAGARVLEAAADAALAGRTALVVVHRLSQAARADHVVVMHEGRIVEEGTHDELVDADGRYARLWHAWSAP